MKEQSALLVCLLNVVVCTMCACQGLSVGAAFTGFFAGANLLIFISENTTKK